VSPVSTIDSSKISKTEENPLEILLKEKELTLAENLEKEKQKSLNQKWKVRPNVAPIYVAASKGSPIDEQFADNTKNFERDMSYGLGVDYAVNSKLSIRTGVNKFEIGYNTYDIVYSANLFAKTTSNGSINTISTINRLPETRNIVISDKKEIQSREIANQTETFGYLNQKIGYVEVPLEISYSLLNRKIGIQLISGVSTMFLNSNEVSLISANRQTILGQANNLNKVHFSTNVGLGFKYGFWKSFEANIEPVLKYQLNTFSEKSGGFNPFMVGVYSGVSYKF